MAIFSLLLGLTVSPTMATGTGRSIRLQLRGERRRPADRRPGRSTPLQRGADVSRRGAISRALSPRSRLRRLDALRRCSLGCAPLSIRDAGRADVFPEFADQPRSIAAQRGVHRRNLPWILSGIYYELYVWLADQCSAATSLGWDGLTRRLALGWVGSASGAALLLAWDAFGWGTRRRASTVANHGAYRAKSGAGDRTSGNGKTERPPAAAQKI